jgi:cytochrome P450
MNIKNVLLQVAAEIFIGEKDDKQQIEKMNQAFVDCAGGQLYIFPINLPGFTYYKGLKGKKFLKNYFNNLVPRKREGDGKDMLSHFCREKDEYGNYFTNEEVADQAHFLLFAAHDTTSSAITNTIYYLARNPEVKQKLYEECLSVGKDHLEYDDLDLVPYMQQVFNEVQRIIPSVPLLPRRTIRETEMAGYKIPAHTMVYTMPRFTHNMEEYWSEPTKFDPDRFSPDRMEHKKHPFQFHPFGGGAHKCIGMHFSQMEYKCFMHKFMLTYDFESAHKADDVAMMSFPLPKPSDDMPVILKKR